ncbi:MAG: SOS response-associated peptidase [Acidobacteriota bacterium]|nr:SOS response-associated peptidase [Acidobacteriota bacterium]
MCGRYTLTAPSEVIAEVFDVAEVTAELSPRYNIAPTQETAIVGLNHEGKRTLGTMRWGLIPHWAKDPSIGNRLINARSETAAEKPSFRSSFKKRRCLVPADGFYEWKKLDGRKQPYYLRLKEHRPFAFAGLWARWSGEDDQPVLSFTLLTTEPNELAKEVHDRMPVILQPKHYDTWLDPEVHDREQLEAMLGSYPAEEMETYAVSTEVNSPRNDRPSCIEPLEG